MSDLKKQLIKLGSTHPELRPHIRQILKSQGRTAALGKGPHPLDPKKAVVAFSVENRLNYVNAILKAYKRNPYDREKAFRALDPTEVKDAPDVDKFERKFLAELKRILGIGPIKKLEYDSNGTLMCAIPVRSYKDVATISKALPKGGFDVIKGSTPYLVAMDFILYPEGENVGVQAAYGSHNWHPVNGTIHDWLRLHRED